MRSASFDRLGGWLAFAVGIGGLVYSIAFVIFLQTGSTASARVTSIALLIGGILSTAVFVSVYQRLRETDAAFALWALLLGSIAALGSAIHGGFDLANLINPPTAARGDLPNPVDPRGLLTFGLTALALFVISWLIQRGSSFAKRLAYLGYVAAVLLVVVYLGRLIILNPKDPLLLSAAAISGFVANPAWFVWLGITLLRTELHS